MTLLTIPTLPRSFMKPVSMNLISCTIISILMTEFLKHHSFRSCEDTRPAMPLITRFVGLAFLKPFAHLNQVFTCFTEKILRNKPISSATIDKALLMAVTTPFLSVKWNLFD